MAFIDLRLHLYLYPFCTAIHRGKLLLSATLYTDSQWQDDSVLLTDVVVLTDPRLNVGVGFQIPIP
jgi:hypothetical protein